MDQSVAIRNRSGVSSATNQSENAESANLLSEVCGIGVVSVDPNYFSQYLVNLTSKDVSRWRASLEKNASVDVRNIVLFMNYFDTLRLDSSGSPELMLALLADSAKRTKNPAIFAVTRNFCRESDLDQKKLIAINFPISTG